MTPPNGWAEIEALYGHPAKADGNLDAAWFRTNIVLVEPPDGWVLRYQQDAATLFPTTGVRMHRLVADAWLAAMHAEWLYAQAQAPADPLAWLQSLRLDQHGGGFNFRPQRDSTKLSMHAFGCAWDRDPIHNPRRQPLTCTIPGWCFNIWHGFGWTDGRHFATPDPMHFQFASGA